MPAPPPAAPSSSALTGGRPSPAPDGATPLRIRVTDLDSIEQAQLWRRYGPQEAIARVVAMIRSALLLSDEIIVDRNQLLDGIALLALGPDDLRWHLGLPPTARLPIVVSCAPDPQTGLIDVSHQLAAVSSAEFLSAANVALARSSASPLEWLMPDREAAPSAARDTFSTPWSAEEEGPSGLPSELLRTAREAWGEAMVRGHVKLVRWSPITLRTDLGDARALCAELPVLGEQLEVIGERTERRTLLRALDERRDRYGDSECRRAFRWWTERYYDAICDAHDEIRISFSQSSERNGEAQGARAGLRGRWRMIRFRLSRREIRPRHDVPFEGEIVENMRAISPGGFQQLRHSPARVHEFWAAPSNRRIWNLAVAVRRSMGRPRVRREKLLAVLAT